jgi:hypothetical protein
MSHDFKQLLHDADYLGRQLQIVLEAPAGTVTLDVLASLMPSTTKLARLIPDLVEIRDACIEDGDYGSAAVVRQIVERLLRTGEEVQALVSRHVIDQGRHDIYPPPENDLAN